MIQHLVCTGKQPPLPCTTTRHRLKNDLICANKSLTPVSSSDTLGQQPSLQRHREGDILASARDTKASLHRGPLWSAPHSFCPSDGQVTSSWTLMRIILSAWMLPTLLLPTRLCASVPSVPT